MKTDLAKKTALQTAMKNQPVGKRVEVSDTVFRNLRARVIRGEDGSVSGIWGVRFKTGSIWHRYTLGAVGTMSGEEARAAAMQAKLDVKAGRPVESVRLAKTGEAKPKAAPLTLADLLYVDAPGRPSYQTVHWSKLKSGAEAARSVRNVFGPLLDRPAMELTPEDFEAVYLTHADRAPHAAARALTWLERAADHFMRRKQMPRDALDLVTDHKQPIVTRDRVLSPDEWCAVWRATEALYGRFPPQMAALQLAMMTGCRSSEAATLEVQHLDLDVGLWNLPSANAKNGREHVIVLNATAVRVLRDRIAFRTEHGITGRYFFSTDREGQTYVRLGSKIKPVIDETSGVTGWRVHDLRRSFATHLSEGGIATEIVDLMLNHAASASRSGVVGTYIKSAKLQERRAAADRWDVITRQWLTGDRKGGAADNVVVLGAG